MPDPAVALLVSGAAHEGWTAVEVTDSLEALASTFTLEYSDHPKADAQASNGPLRARIGLGEACTVRVGKEDVITGFVDEPGLEETATDRRLSVSGRSKTCDLADCSAIRKPASWTNATLDTIATDLCGPFGLAVTVGAGVQLGAPFRSFALEPGETVLDALSRAARQRCLVFRTTPKGNLEIAPVGPTKLKTPLERGKTIISARLRRSMVDRFSEIRLRSQADGLLGPGYQAEAVATDSAIKRHRPLVVLSDCSEAQAELAKRAAWEVSSRLGKGSRVSLTVRGWLHDGKVWRPNTIVRVRHEWLELDDELLVATVQLSLNDDSGHTTALELCPVDAYRPAPPVKPKVTWP